MRVTKINVEVAYQETLASFSVHPKFYILSPTPCKGGLFSITNGGEFLIDEKNWDNMNGMIKNKGD